MNNMAATEDYVQQQCEATFQRMIAERQDDKVITHRNKTRIDLLQQEIAVNASLAHFADYAIRAEDRSFEKNIIILDVNKTHLKGPQLNQMDQQFVMKVIDEVTEGQDFGFVMTSFHIEHVIRLVTTPYQGTDFTPKFNGKDKIKVVFTDPMFANVLLKCARMAGYGDTVVREVSPGKREYLDYIHDHKNKLNADPDQERFYSVIDDRIKPGRKRREGEQPKPMPPSRGRRRGGGRGGPRGPRYCGAGLNFIPHNYQFGQGNGGNEFDGGASGSNPGNDPSNQMDTNQRRALPAVTHYTDGQPIPEQFLDENRRPKQWSVRYRAGLYDATNSKQVQYGPRPLFQSSPNSRDTVNIVTRSGSVDVPGLAEKVDKLAKPRNEMRNKRTVQQRSPENAINQQFNREPNKRPTKDNAEKFDKSIQLVKEVSVTQVNPRKNRWKPLTTTVANLQQPKPSTPDVVTNAIDTQPVNTVSDSSSSSTNSSESVVNNEKTITGDSEDEDLGIGKSKTNVHDSDSDIGSDDYVLPTPSKPNEIDDEVDFAKGSHPIRSIFGQNKITPQELYDQCLDKYHALMQKQCNSESDMFVQLRHDTELLHFLASHHEDSELYIEIEEWCQCLIKMIEPLFENTTVNINQHQFSQFLEKCRLLKIGAEQPTMMGTLLFSKTLFQYRRSVMARGTSAAHKRLMREKMNANLDASIVLKNGQLQFSPNK